MFACVTRHYSRKGARQAMSRSSGWSSRLSWLSKWSG